ncbi:MAG: hypothetical protein IPM79_03240 [Polyangiaceae bacterium]|nr:hypothetical protein [Polyangiaceae bacterium]
MGALAVEEALAVAGALAAGGELESGSLDVAVAVAAGVPSSSRMRERADSRSGESSSASLNRRRASAVSPPNFLVRPSLTMRSAAVARRLSARRSPGDSASSLSVSVLTFFPSGASQSRRSIASFAASSVDSKLLVSSRAASSREPAIASAGTTTRSEAMSRKVFQVTGFAGGRSSRSSDESGRGFLTTGSTSVGSAFFALFAGSFGGGSLGSMGKGGGPFGAPASGARGMGVKPGRLERGESAPFAGAPGCDGPGLTERGATPGCEGLTLGGMEARAGGLEARAACAGGPTGAGRAGS